MHSSIRSICLLALLAGCHWGNPPRRYPPAQGPTGAQVAVRVVGEATDRVGELYAADSAGIIVRATRLIRIPWSRLQAIDVLGMSRGYDVVGRPRDADHLARLAALSRFPQGLSDDLLRRVLDRIAQDSLDVAAGLTLDSLARVAERSTARFHDRRAAMAEGYRRVGADFPGMGEHWVNPVALLEDAIDPARPSFLTYVTMERGETRLMGVGFITTTGTDRAPNVPGFAEHWHEHSGLLSEESGARAGVIGSDEPAVGGSRVWVLHVWTSLDNPDGRFAADNWSLPFARGEVIPPPIADADAARAFGLAGRERGDEFLRALLSDAGLRTAATAAATDSIIAAARERAGRIVAKLPRSSPVDAHSLTELRSTWRAMSMSLAHLLGGHTAALLAPPHRSRGHEHARH